MPSLLCILAASNSGHPYLFFFVLFAVGLILFIVGFRKFRELRLLTDTPLVPVRSMPMGLVHVFGKATGEDRLTSPLTRTVCFYYKVKVEKRVKRDNKEEWQHYSDETAEREFYLEDATGRVLVNPKNAKLDVPRTLFAEVEPTGGIKPRIDPTLGSTLPSREDLYGYLTRGQKQIACQSARILSLDGAGWRWIALEKSFVSNRRSLKWCRVVVAA